MTTYVSAVADFPSWDEATETVAVSDVAPILHYARQYVSDVAPEDLHSFGQLWPLETWRTHEYGYVMLLSYSDYGGSAIDVANERKLATVYSDEPLITVTGDFGSTGVVLPMAARIGVCLAESLVGLCDYPLLSDETFTEYETELADEALRDWWPMDFHASHECDSHLDEDQLAGVAWQAMADHGEYPYAEAATSVVFPRDLESWVHNALTRARLVAYDDAGGVLSVGFCEWCARQDTRAACDGCNVVPFHIEDDELPACLIANPLPWSDVPKRVCQHCADTPDTPRSWDELPITGVTVAPTADTPDTGIGGCIRCGTRHA